MRNEEQCTEERLRMAATAYGERCFGRSDATKPPDGDVDEDGAWWPSESERRPCCDDVRQPSAANKFSLKYHCATQKHLANLFDVDPLELQRELRRQRKAERTGWRRENQVRHHRRSTRAEQTVDKAFTVAGYLESSALLFDGATELLEVAFDYAERHRLFGLGET